MLGSQVASEQDGLQLQVY